MKKRLICLLSLIICLSAVFGSISVSALEPSYAVSQEYIDGGYYDRLVAYELTGDPRYDVLSIALSQLGYHEGDSDEDMDGLNIDGDRNFVEYNRLYGKVDNKEGNGVSYGYAWCASFVTWCLRQAGVSFSQAINSISCSGMTDWYIRNDIFYYSIDGHIPRAGDIIMFSTNNDPSHVGLVLGVLEDEVYTVEGNNGGNVDIHSYELTDDYILGYCVPKYDESLCVKDCAPLLTDNINKTGEFIVNAKSLNVRSAPGNDCEILGALTKHSTVNVTALDGSWGKIDFEGQEGWIYMPHTTDADYMVYTVSYDLDGGEGKEYQRKLKGGTVVITDKKPTKKGYDFVGWSDDKDSNQPNFKAGDKYSEDADITLYAIWTPATYTVSFYDDDGTLLHSQECSFNDWVPTIEDPIKESDGEYKYEFAGWSPEPVQVVVKDLEYRATYTATALTDEEKEALSESAEESLTEVSAEETTSNTEKKAAETEKNNTVLYVVIALAIAVVAIGAFILFKKKKQ